MPYANKEDERVYRKKYYALNKKKIKDRANKHYNQNKEQHKKSSAEYRETDIGKSVVAESRDKVKNERKQTTEISIAKNTYYKRWNYAEDYILVTMKENKNTWKEISTQLDRSLKSVEARYKKLQNK